jgi:hypothetical protein
MKLKIKGLKPLLSIKDKTLKRYQFSRVQLAIFGFTFAVVGGVILLVSHAAGPSVSFEAEGATLSGAATVGNDASASGGQYVQFGGSTGSNNVTLPARAAFYYPWFPETWSVNGVHVAYNPLLGYYDSSTQSVVDTHIGALDYDGVKVAIASWWGVNTHSENTRIPQLLTRTQALGSNLKWALYYEEEGAGDPTVAQIQTELDYINTNYATSQAYAHVNGKPVLFVYNASAADTTCAAVADKWNQANTGKGFYIVLKVFTGYASCTNQPDNWHQYSPAVATDSQPGHSYTIAPGFWRADEATPRLARDPTRWTSNIASMKASNAPWQLVTTFDEWGEGTAVEAAQEWTSASGFGVYQDALHNNL